jgi:putative addiction module killer protein
MYTVQQSPEFVAWLDRQEVALQARVARRLELAGADSLGDTKSVGDGVSEMRVFYGPGVRLYFTRRHRILIIMLAGGEKSSQAADIKRAQKLAKEQYP